MNLILRLLLLFVLCPHSFAAETLVYKRAGDRELRLHLEKPDDWKATDRRPAVVFFFGGGWVGGNPQQFRPQSEYFAGRGMVGIRVEYRTIPKGDKGPPTVCCADAKSALRYVRGHAAELGIDPARIAAAGGSAGGHLAAFTAMVDGLDDPADDRTISCKPDALLLFNPVFNNGPGQWGHERVGGRFLEFSPAHHVSRSAPPACVFLGDADKLIGVPVLREFEAAMKTAGVRCEARVYPGAGHGFFNSEPHRSQTLAEADQFLVSIGWLKSAAAPPAAPAGARKPNVIVILADDLGYGDVHCYNPERGRIPTPNLDSLAGQGMRFTDAHTSSGVCSPTRYSLLTGRYHWRTRLQAGIVPYLGAPLIAPDRLTIADLFKSQGYRTAAIGKWHLGWDWGVAPEERPLFGRAKNGPVEVTEAHRAAWRRVYGARLRGGPLDCGFDSYFGTDVPNWPPFTFIDGDRIPAIPDEFLPESQFANSLASQRGPAVKGWNLEAILPSIAGRACAVIEAAANNPEPFFLYLPLTAPHTPIAVAAEWQGKSGLNPYADFVMQTDATVGRVLASLEKSGAAANTIVIFTSDNGCAPYIGAKELEAKGHYPSGPWRGYKADAWEGGHRVPFMVRWPGTVAAGSRCDALVQQTDLMATLAAALGTPLPGGAGEDSVSMLPLWKGSTKAVREFAISHGSSGLPSLRRGSWKIIFGPGGGGFSAGKAQGAGQLYDLAADPGESTSLWDQRPELVTELTAKMEELVSAHPNDVPVKWQRFLTRP